MWWYFKIVFFFRVGFIILKLYKFDLSKKSTQRPQGPKGITSVVGRNVLFGLKLEVH